MTRSAVPLLLALLALAGCGDDESDSPTTAASTSAAPATTAQTTTAPATPTATTSAEPVDRAADAKIAEQALLRAADLPPDWKEGTDADEPSKDSPCPAIEAAKAATTARAKSATFSRDDTTINSNVYLFPTAGEAQANLAAVTSAATRDCLVQATLAPVRAAARKAKATIGELQTGEIPLGSIGEAASAYRIVLPITEGGRKDVLTFVVSSTRRGRGLSLLTLVGINNDSTQKLAATADRRLTDALAVGP